MSDEHLEVADWRRRVAVMWQAWRTASAVDAAEATQAFRADKDRLFAEHPQSPLLPEKRDTFSGIPYWPYDPAWRMTVMFEPVDAGSSPAPVATLGGTLGGFGGLGGPDAIALPNSGNETIAFRKIGRVQLAEPLAGQSLAVFWIQGYGGGIFLPFRDATSGGETYGAGRYLLDTIKSADHGGDPAAATMTLDFNLAYHPSCAYDPKWSCPLAPPENTLHVPVSAGERLGDQAH